MSEPLLSITLPDWLQEYAESADVPVREDRMRFAINLAGENVARKTGGPFGAAIFTEEGRLVSVGVNLVVAGSCSILHAEVVAIMLAQKNLGRYDIGDGGKFRTDLFTSVEPCAMCFGAVPWSGVTGLVCGARDEDARQIGFDEGPKLPDWPRHLRERGIAVTRDVLRDESVSVLRQYISAGGRIYNP